MLSPKLPQLSMHPDGMAPQPGAGLRADVWWAYLDQFLDHRISTRDYLGLIHYLPIPPQPSPPSLSKSCPSGWVSSWAWA